MTFEAFGVTIQLDIDVTAFEHEVHQVLPPGSMPCPPKDSATRFGLREIGLDSYEVTHEGRTVLVEAPLDVALQLLDSQIRLCVAARTSASIFVHAGVVALDDRALVLPGESFSGKTTLVRALVDRGATYYSDEYAVFDEHGLVHPYPRPLRIRTATATRSRHVAELGGTAGTRPARLSVVAVTRYRPGGQWRPRGLPTGQAVLALLANAVPAQERPRESIRALARAVSGATLLESERGEAGQVADALLEALAPGVNDNG